MLEVVVCVGSTCHVHGSAYVVQSLQRLIAEHGLEAAVELKASFCMGGCRNGICMTVGGEKITGVGPENVEAVFDERILTAIATRDGRTQTGSGQEEER